MPSRRDAPWDHLTPKRACVVLLASLSWIVCVVTLSWEKYTVALAILIALWAWDQLWHKLRRTRRKP